MAVSWVLQRLPSQVLEGQRSELIRTLHRSRNLIVEVEVSPAAVVPFGTLAAHSAGADVVGVSPFPTFTLSEATTAP
jgi:hypothetical protein